MPKESCRNSLEFITPVSFLLSLMIVFHHSFTVNVDYNGSFLPQSYGWTIGIQRFMYNISECAVPMFYFLSAYLFFRTFDGSWMKYKQKMKRRFFSLVIPYILFCTFGYIKHIVATSGGGHFIGYLHSLWICDTMPLWFIRELMALSIMAPIFYSIKKNLLLSILICIICIVLASAGIAPYRSFIYWIPVYLLGTMMTDSKLEEIRSFMVKSKIKVMVFIMAVLYVYASWYLPNGMSRFEMNWIQNLAFIMFRIATPIILLPMMLMILARGIKERRYMNYSFFVYCMHFPVITILGIILDRIVGSSWTIELVKYFIIVFSSYSICVIMAIALQTYTPRLWYILNGSR